MQEAVHKNARKIRTMSGESEVVGEQHRDYYLALAEEAAPRLYEADQGEWLSLLETEHDNLRAVLSWCLQKQGDEVATALRLCGALQPFWLMRGHIEEGRQWCEAALKLAEASDRSVERAKVLKAAGVLARMQGDYATARAYHEQGLVIYREVEDKKGIAASFNGLGNLACSQGDDAEARYNFEQSLAVKREMGDKTGIAGALNNLGFVAYRQGDYSSARDYYQQSLALRREVGNANRQAVAGTLEGLAEVSSAEGALEQGALLWGAAETLREQIGSSLHPDEKEAHDRYVAAARQALGEEAFAVAWEKGRSMILEQSLDFGLGIEGIEESV